MQKKLKDLGYFASKDISKLVLLFEETGKRKKKSIPTLLLEGDSGVGKTFLSETFAKLVGADTKFVQCFPRMGTENFQYDVNIEAVIRQDADKSIKEGILLQTLKQSEKTPVVLVIDELDKARPDVDSFLLDFLENGRLTTGTDTYKKGNYPIYTFITSNNKREIDEAVLNRSRKVDLLRPDKEMFLEILGLPDSHHLGYVYKKCPDFSIRQAKQYLEDIDILGVEFDESALSQYIHYEDLNITSLADLQRLEDVGEEGIEIEVPSLERCKMMMKTHGEKSAEEWLKLLQNETTNILNFGYDYENSEYYTMVDTLEQLQTICKYIEIPRESYYENSYKGWFEYSISDEDMLRQNIIWAANKNEKDNTRFGIKISGEKMFKIASNRGINFVYLNSENFTLEEFLVNLVNKEQEKKEDYKTDGEYDESGIDYGD